MHHLHRFGLHGLTKPHARCDGDQSFFLTSVDTTAMMASRRREYLTKPDRISSRERPPLPSLSRLRKTASAAACVYSPVPTCDQVVSET